MAKILGSIWISLFVSSCAQSPHQIENHKPAESAELESQKCEISIQEREALMKLDYKSFDQALPGGGWRKYQNCLELTRSLIDEYVQLHLATLEKQYLNVLVWHSGQISGFLGDYAQAIASMNQTIKADEKPSDALLWNPYVRATIAFLKKDRQSLLKERAKLARGSSPYNHMNLRKVDAFIRCFKSTYQAAYSDTCEPKETNIDRLRSLAIRVNYKEILPEQFMGLRDFLRQKKIILVGEIHGTQEVPELFENLVASIANDKTKTLVVLEINQASQASIDSFLKSGDESVLKHDIFFSREYQDGRSSKAMVELLKRLATLPNTTVLCMDPMTANLSMTGQERDTGMANFINSNWRRFDNTLVLSGNVHSSITVGTPWEKDFRPMGYELKSMAKDLGETDIFNILIRHEKVDSWNCQGVEASSCQARYGKRIQSDYSKAVTWKSYFVAENPLFGGGGTLPNGHLSTIFIRTTKVSFPYVRAGN